MNYKKFSLIFGFSVWLIATLVFKFWGHSFFFVENQLLLAAFYLGTIPVLYYLVRQVFLHYNLDTEAQLRSAIFMALPGMAGDTICIKFHYVIFPQLTMAQSVVLASWVIWAYLIVLFVGVMNRKRIKAT